LPRTQEERVFHVWTSRAVGKKFIEVSMSANVSVATLAHEDIGPARSCKFDIPFVIIRLTLALPTDGPQREDPVPEVRQLFEPEDTQDADKKADDASGNTEDQVARLRVDVYSENASDDAVRNKDEDFDKCHWVWSYLPKFSTHTP